MHLVVLPAENDAEATLHGLEETADHAWEHCSDDHTKPDSPKVELGGVITPDKHKCYNLHFDSDVWQSLFKVRVRVGLGLGFASPNRKPHPRCATLPTPCWTRLSRK